MPITRNSRTTTDAATAAKQLIDEAVAEVEEMMLDEMEAELARLREENAALRTAPAPAPRKARRRQSAGRTAGGVSLRDAVPQVLGRTPMSPKEVTEAVLQVNGVGLKGKTPEATVAAFLATEAKKGDGLVRRTAPGRYALRGRSRSKT